MKQEEVDGKTTVNNRHYILVGYYSNLSGKCSAHQMLFSVLYCHLLANIGNVFGVVNTFLLVSLSPSLPT